MLYFDRWKIIMIFVLCFAGLVYSAPNFVPKDKLAGVPDWLPNQQINLGLDLRGGSYLLLGVETDSIVQDRLQELVNDVRNALRNARIPYTGLGLRDGGVSVSITAPEDMSKAKDAVDDIASTVPGNRFSTIPSSDIDIKTQDNRIFVTLTEAEKFARTQSAVKQSIEIVRRRIDELGTTEPVIQQQGSDRILVQVPGLDDPQRLKELLGQTAKMNFRLVSNAMSGAQALATRTVPAGTEILYTVDEPKQPVLVERRVMVGGERLVDAQPSFDQRDGQPVVNFRFDSAGARQFGQISGNFTVQAANDLAILLRAGALPAPLNVLEERTVGPGLGADSIRAGEVAAIIGAVAVVVFMVLSYGFFGVLANIALILNVAMIFAVLSILQATLTLPGIAGIVLTIGMAVDANVLIYERIREETAAGKSPIPAIEAGYNRALSSILDANITTLISAAILFQLGSGPVKGFAVTLAIGIVTSVFTAFTVNRLMVSIWLRRRRPKTINL